MEEDTDLFLLHARLPEAVGTPEIEAFVGEHFDPLMRTAPRRSPAASDRTSGGSYVPAVVYDISPEAEEGRREHRRQLDASRGRAEEERYARRQAQYWMKS